MPKFDRKAMREKLLERHKESYNNKDDSGKYASIFKDLPSKMERWKVSEDEHMIDHIPYVASKNHPNVPAGDPAYCVDVWVHRGVGPAEGSYVCPSRTFKKPCPVCELQKQMKEQDEFDEQAVKKMSPTRRVIYNVWVHDSTKDEEKGVQLWDASHFLYEKELAELAKLPKGGGFVEYTDPDIGKLVSFKRTGKGALSTKYAAFRFLEREQPIPDTILESAIIIEDYIHFATYDEIHAALYGKTVQTEEEEETNTLPEPVKEEPKEEPVRRRSRTGTAPKEDNPCPYGHKFGIDIEQFEDCQKCEKWDPCSVKADELEAQKEAEPEPEPEPVKEEPIRRRRRSE